MGLFIFIAVLILAAASTVIIRSLTSPNGAGNSVTVTSTPTDETAGLKTNLLPMSHRGHGGASIKTGSAKVVRKKYTATASASTKRKRAAVRSRIHARAASDDYYQVYDGGRRVGADPDLNIRMTLARQHTWLN
jgi:hypothetical protein